MYPIVAAASSVRSLQMRPIRKQAARRLTRTLKLQLMREWEGCIGYMLPSPAGTANEIHTISSKEVHNCSLLPPFDVHQPHYSTYCLSGQSYNVLRSKHSEFQAAARAIAGFSTDLLLQTEVDVCRARRGDVFYYTGAAAAGPSCEVIYGSLWQTSPS